MFKIEKPIKKDKEDLLGYSPVAKELSRMIKTYPENDSITIGIQGKWGEGKTSFINLTLNELEQDENIIIVKFNPWLISTKKQLISDFFSLLSNELGIIENKNEAKTIGMNLKKLSNIFKPLALIPNLSLVVSEATKVLETVGGALEAIGKEKEENLEGLKEKINKGLNESNKKIVIVIDDIDRLIDNEINEVFQLVKSIADFDNTIYLLSYDKEIVSKSLNKLQHEKGEEYLEKIIQIPLDLPHVDRGRLTNIFFNKLKISLKSTSEEHDQAYFNELYNNGLMNNFGNLREVNRFFNLFTFNLTLAREELNIYDHIVITLLKLQEPIVYNYIRKNKNSFSGLKFGDQFGYSEGENKEEVKQEFKELLSRSKKINKKTLEDLLKTVFPKLKQLESNTTLGGDFLEEWTKERRIASPEYFDIYFKMTFPEDKISRKELEKIINFKTKEELEGYFEVSNKKRIKSLERLPEVIEKLKDETHIIIFLEVVFGLIEKLEDEESLNLFHLFADPKYRVYRLFMKVMETLDREKYIRIIKSIFSGGKIPLVDSFYLLEKIKERKILYNQEMPSEVIDELINVTIERAREQSKGKNDLPRDFLRILYAIKRQGREEVSKEIFKTYKEKDRGLPKLLESLVNKSTETSGYEVKEKEFMMKNHINDFCNYDALLDLVKQEIIDPTQREEELINLLENAKEKDSFE